MKGKHSTRCLIVKQIFAVTIKGFFFLKENHLVTHPLLIQLMWFRKWLFIFDSFLILLQTTHLSFTTTIYPLQWRIQGRDPEVRPPPYFLTKLRQNVFWRPAHPCPPPTNPYYFIVKRFWMQRPISFSTKYEYPPVPEGRVIHQTILHLLV